MFFIRADSNPTISGGHIMRCLAIAKAVMESCQEVTFLVADDNPVKILKDEGVSYINLNSDWRNLMTDIDQVKDILSKTKNSFLLIDSYRITKEYVNILKPYAKIGYIGSKLEYLGNLDFLINYSTDVDFDFYQNNYSDGTKLLLGAVYAPLRKEFQHIELQYRRHIKRILLTTGNTDKDRIVEELLEKLIPILRGRDIIVDVVIGRMFENQAQLHTKYDGNPNIILHENVTSMSTLMKSCDLALSANGTTVYELSAMGLPTISFSMVEEQVRSAEKLDSLGAMDYCGRSYADQRRCVEQIICKVQYYIENDQERVNLARRAHELIDGNGCQKIVHALFQH